MIFRGISIFYRSIVIILSIIFFVINIRLYDGASGTSIETDTLKQLNYLEHALQHGAGQEMQALFPEGFFFMHVLYGLTWVEYARHFPLTPPVHERALQQARWALDQLESDEGKRVFNQTLNPPYGVFYAGWHAWLQGGILAIQDPQAYDAAEVEQFIISCEQLEEAFSLSETPFLPSYKGAAWPSDALIGIAALQLHDHLFDSRFERIAAQWVSEAKSRLDLDTGLIPHEVNSPSGNAIEGARGSSQSLMLRFLIEVDADLAKTQYNSYRNLFVTTLAGIPGIREYPKGKSGAGDIDSGPVVFNIGTAATIVAMGTARAYGDQSLAEPLMQTIEALGLPFTWAKKKRYLFGQMPIGDAFLAWSHVAKPFTVQVATETDKPSVAWWWRIPLHSVTIFTVVLLWVPIFSRRFSSIRTRSSD